jgi:prevent-host-death family protein
MFMKTVGSYEAKTHLPQLLQDVERGRAFIITRKGRPIAELRPVAHRSAEEQVARIRAFRERLRAAHAPGSVLRPGETWRAVIHDDEA